MYVKYLKRFFDFVLSLFALIILSPVLIVLTVAGFVMMRGNPFFVQPRPGIKDADGNEKIFKLIKLRTMTNAKDKNGNLLPDDVRLTPYGKWLRSTSLDELFELINIIKGDMSIIGPRPQLVRDMVFMSDRQRERHNVRPGLSGLAQVRGRNAISWEGKLDSDLEYVRHVTLIGDIKIILQTVVKVLKREGISAEGVATADDYGDELLNSGKIDRAFYDAKQKEAKVILKKWGFE